MLKLSPLYRRNLPTLIMIWLVWSVVMVSFQSIVQNRYQPFRPDRATEWTPSETARTSQRGKPYLIDPFMNNQVSWDSEFYLSIATIGYDDPDIRLVSIPDGEEFSMNYAFFPLYPMAMSIVRLPLTLLGLSPIGASTLAGVLIALVGTLGGMIALFDLTRDTLGEDGGRRTAFYLLIFPTSFFLAQVYTEGMFIGLAFGSLAFLHRRQWLWAIMLACLATWTRSIGVFLVAPLVLMWLHERGWSYQKPLVIPRLDDGRWWYPLLLLAPIGAYLIWQIALGTPFTLVQDNWFGRGAFDLERFVGGFAYAIMQFLEGDNTQMRVYYGMEFFAILVGFIACAVTMRRYPFLAIFSLFALFIPLTSGAPQSLIRYVLAMPSLHIMLAHWGKSEVFDRGWLTTGILLMAMQASLFTFDMWVA